MAKSKTPLKPAKARAARPQAALRRRNPERFQINYDSFTPQVFDATFGRIFPRQNDAPAQNVAKFVQRHAVFARVGGEFSLLVEPASELSTTGSLEEMAEYVYEQLVEAFRHDLTEVRPARDAYTKAQAQFTDTLRRLRQGGWDITLPAPFDDWANQPDDKKPRLDDLYTWARVDALYEAGQDKAAEKLEAMLQKFKIPVGSDVIRTKTKPMALFAVEATLKTLSTLTPDSILVAPPSLKENGVKTRKNSREFHNIEALGRASDDAWAALSGCALIDQTGRSFDVTAVTLRPDKNHLVKLSNGKEFSRKVIVGDASRGIEGKFPKVAATVALAPLLVVPFPTTPGFTGTPTFAAPPPSPQAPPKAVKTVAGLGKAGALKFAEQLLGYLQTAWAQVVTGYLNESTPKVFWMGLAGKADFEFTPANAGFSARGPMIEFKLRDEFWYSGDLDYVAAGPVLISEKASPNVTIPIPLFQRMSEAMAAHVDAKRAVSELAEYEIEKLKFDRTRPVDISGIGTQYQSRQTQARELAPEGKTTSTAPMGPGRAPEGFRGAKRRAVAKEEARELGKVNYFLAHIAEDTPAYKLDFDGTLTYAGGILPKGMPVRVAVSSVDGEFVPREVSEEEVPGIPEGLSFVMVDEGYKPPVLAEPPRGADLVRQQYFARSALAAADLKNRALLAAPSGEILTALQRQGLPTGGYKTEDPKFGSPSRKFAEVESAAKLNANRAKLLVELSERMGQYTQYEAVNRALWAGLAAKDAAGQRLDLKTIEENTRARVGLGDEINRLRKEIAKFHVSVLSNPFDKAGETKMNALDAGLSREEYRKAVTALGDEYDVQIHPDEFNAAWDGGDAAHRAYEENVKRQAAVAKVRTAFVASDAIQLAFQPGTGAKPDVILDWGVSAKLGLAEKKQSDQEKASLALQSAVKREKALAQDFDEVVEMTIGNAEMADLLSALYISTYADTRMLPTRKNPMAWDDQGAKWNKSESLDEILEGKGSAESEEGAKEAVMGTAAAVTTALKSFQSKDKNGEFEDLAFLKDTTKRRSFQTQLQKELWGVMVKVRALAKAYRVAGEQIPKLPQNYAEELDTPMGVLSGLDFFPPSLVDLWNAVTADTKQSSLANAWTKTQAELEKILLGPTSIVETLRTAMVDPKLRTASVAETFQDLRSAAEDVDVGGGSSVFQGGGFSPPPKATSSSAEQDQNKSTASPQAAPTPLSGYIHVPEVFYRVGVGETPRRYSRQKARADERKSALALLWAKMDDYSPKLETPPVAINLPRDKAQLDVLKVNIRERAEKAMTNYPDILKEIGYRSRFPIPAAVVEQTRNDILIVLVPENAPDVEGITNTAQIWIAGVPWGSDIGPATQKVQGAGLVAWGLARAFLVGKKDKNPPRYANTMSIYYWVVGTPKAQLLEAPLDETMRAMALAKRQRGRREMESLTRYPGARPLGTTPVSTGPLSVLILTDEDMEVGPQASSYLRVAIGVSGGDVGWVPDSGETVHRVLQDAMLSYPRGPQAIYSNDFKRITAGTTVAIVSYSKDNPRLGATSTAALEDAKQAGARIRLLVAKDDKGMRFNPRR